MRPGISAACISIAFSAALFSAAALAQSAAPAAGAPAQAAAPTPAGRIDLIQGDVRIIPAGGAPRRAAVGDVVNEGDTLASGKDSEAQITMQDAGFIALRADTRFRIVNYRADGGDDDKGIFRLIVGGVRSVTGWIGKYNRRSYLVRTPSATIGIRGTDHETRYIPEGSAEGEPGTYDKVFAGQTTLEAGGGQAQVSPDQAGFVPISSGARPRLLARVPGFFRPGPHEDIINRKHAEIQQIIEQRRDERRKVIAEKRAALDAAGAQLKAQVESNQAAAEQRRAAAEAQRQQSQDSRGALAQQRQSLQQTQKDIQEKRKALNDGGAAAPTGSASPPVLTPTERAQRRALRKEVKSAAGQREQIQDARESLEQGNKAATAQRQQETVQQQQAAKAQRQDVQEKRQDLQQERESAKEEIKALREQERKRYIDELKKDRQGAAPAAKDDAQ